MRYELADLPLKSLLPALGDAEDQLARLDERVARSEVGAGFIERGHFFDAAASMWVNGELVHVEDLVLRDAWMDIRTPTHETGLAHGIVRARRKIAAAPAGWPLTSAGLKALRGRALDEELPEMDRGRGGEELEHPGDREEDDALAIEFAEIDAVLARSNRLLAGEVEAAPAPVEATMAGDLMIRDPEWNEDERLGAWLDLTAEADRLPPSLGAALLWDAWEAIEPLERQHWLGQLMVGAYLRSRGKVGSHLLAFCVGLRALPRERRRARDTSTRILAYLDAMQAAASAGLKELDRLNLEKGQMERRLRGRRSSSTLPIAIELFLSRPVGTAAMIAATARITPRGALNLIDELGVRELTGRGRYRAWGVL